MRYEPIPPDRCDCNCHKRTILDQSNAIRTELETLDLLEHGVDVNTVLDLLEDKTDAPTKDVDVLDVLEAAVACDACRTIHSPALRSMQLANAPLPSHVGCVALTEWVEPSPVKLPESDNDE